MDSVEARLSKLERSNRWWRFLALLAFAFVSVRLLTGAGEPTSFDTINANRINVVDPQGNVVGMLSGQLGEGDLQLESSHSKSRVLIYPTTEPAIDIENGEGNTVARLSGDTDGGSLLLNASHGKSAVLVNATTAPGIGVINSDGKGIAHLGGDADGTALLELVSSSSKSLIQMRATTQPSIDLANADGNRIVSLGGLADGAGFISVKSATGKERVAMAGHFPTPQPAALDDEAGIKLFADNGEARAALGADSASASFILCTHAGHGAFVNLIASDVNHSGIVVQQAGGGSALSLP